MKILLLGKGVANQGCRRLLQKHNIEFDQCNIDEIQEYSYDYIVKSPGIRLDDDIFKVLRGKVISDIELCYILERPYIIGVTGSNGKTSVVSMLGHILSSRYSVVVCGNIGYSVCDAVVDHENADIFIVELSSFQLEAIQTLDCNISVILNISACHLDHHRIMRNYVDAKLNIATKQSFNHYTVYNMDNPYLKDICKSVISNTVGFSYESTISRIYVLNDYIYYRNKRIYKLNKEEIKYRHKVENYLAVLSVISVLNFNLSKACKLLKTFREVKYRLTRIDEYVYNDAKSTNCASTMAALHALDDVHLICGGYSRGMKVSLDEDSLHKLVAVYAYGETRVELKEYFSKMGIICYEFKTLAEALKSAYIKRMNKEILLYSPMFASFDQYKSYEERGCEFDKEYFLLKNKT